jgi:hypothetical protein
MADLDLTPPALNLTAYAGDDREVTILVTDSGGAPFPLTAPFLCQVRSDYSDPDPAAAELPFTSAVPADGVGVLTIPGSVTAGLLAGAGAQTVQWRSGGSVFAQQVWTGVWDLQQGTDATDDVLTLCGGTFTVKGDVTREAP